VLARAATGVERNVAQHLPLETRAQFNNLAACNHHQRTLCRCVYHTGAPSIPTRVPHPDRRTRSVQIKTVKFAHQSDALVAALFSAQIWVNVIRKNDT
jgi:hypothetical protein